MKKLCIFLLATAIPVAACTPLQTPSDVAAKTKLDEQALLGVELAYKAARIAVGVAVDSGAIVGARKAVWRDYNRKAYQAVTAAETAYDAGNAADYAAAVTNAQTLIAQLLALTGKTADAQSE